jgi:hypothetical protein
MANLEVRHYKVLELPNNLTPNVVYYVLDKKTGKVKTYISDLNGIPIPLLDLTTVGTVKSLVGTGVTGGNTENPRVDIKTFISSQLGNQVYLSEIDGRLNVKPLINRDSSLEIISTATELQIKVSQTIQDVLQECQENISNLQGSVSMIEESITSLEVSKFDKPTGTPTQYLDGTGAPRDFIPVIGDKNYKHTQAVPSMTWIINHNLNKFPSVTIVDTAGNEYEGEVNHTDTNNLTVNLSIETSGIASLN